MKFNKKESILIAFVSAGTKLAEQMQNHINWADINIPWKHRTQMPRDLKTR